MEEFKKNMSGTIYLMVWALIVSLLSGILYGGIEKNLNASPIISNPINADLEIEYVKNEIIYGNDIRTYIELLKMPVESAFQNIRVMITNKKDNSIFYKIKDFENIKKELNEEGYRGKLIYQRAKDRKDEFVVINELPLEEYLYSVVPSEMPSGYPMEALKAQAICARTYAVIHMMNPAFPDYNAHVNDTTSFQVYHNIDEQISTNRAVDETAGQLLFTKEGDTLAEVYYYSTSCGQNCEASTNGEFYEYITNAYTSDVESQESWYRWSCNVEWLDEQHILRRLQTRYQSNPSKILTMTGKDSYESLRICEMDVIKDLFVAKRGDGGVAEELIIATEKNIYKVIGEYNIRYILNDPKTSVIKQDGTKVTMSALLPSAFISLESVKSKDVVIGYKIIGGGYGHGVGMSQNGAKGLANLGYTAEEILDYFFPDSIVSKNL